MARAAASLVVVAASALLSAGCGIESLSFLAPVERIVREFQRIDVYNNPENGSIDDFLGYTLYYKLYPRGSELIGEDIAAIPTDAVSDRLVSRGFRQVTGRLYESENNQAEVAISSYSDDITIRRTFFNAGAAFPFAMDIQPPATADETQLAIRWSFGTSRYKLELGRRFTETTASDRTFAGFWSLADYRKGPDAQSTDLDLRGAHFDDFEFTADAELELIMYVVAVGRNATTFARIESAPAIVTIPSVELQLIGN